jgi:hypothetical protein
VPAWQGRRVPLLIFKVFASGTTAGSDPFYVDIAPPVATTASGIAGALTSPHFAIMALANGTSRVRIIGDNVGRVATRIIFLNSQISRIQGEFSDCERDYGWVPHRTPHDCLPPRCCLLPQAAATSIVLRASL